MVMPYWMVESECKKLFNKPYEECNDDEIQLAQDMAYEYAGSPDEE